MGGWRERWFSVVLGTLGLLLFLSGFLSQNIITMVVGALQAFAALSVFLTSNVRSQHRAKRSLEIVSALIALAIAIYGYVITGSLVLGAIILLVVAILFVAFTLSYVLPRIRVNQRKTNGARNTGRVLERRGQRFHPSLGS